MENIEIAKNEEIDIIIDYVTFREKKIDCLVLNNTPYVIIKSVCENIGLHTKSATSSINSDEILSEVVVEHRPPMPKYRGQKVKCMPIDHIHGWLFGIDINKVKDNVKPVLLQYKRYVYRVLFDHFYGRVKIYDSNVKRRHEIRDRIREVNKEINALMLEHKCLENERKLIAMGEFKQLGLFNDEDQKEYDRAIREGGKLLKTKGNHFNSDAA